MAEATVVKKAKKKAKKVRKRDGFALYVPMCFDQIDLPVLNRNKHAICFTTKEKFIEWKEFTKVDTSKVKVFNNRASIPRMIKVIMIGKHAYGLSIDWDPRRHTGHTYVFKSKMSDKTLEEDQPYIFTVVKGIRAKNK